MLDLDKMGARLGFASFGPKRLCMTGVSTEGLSCLRNTNHVSRCIGRTPYLWDCQPMLSEHKVVKVEVWAGLWRSSSN